MNAYNKGTDLRRRVRLAVGLQPGITVGVLDDLVTKQVRDIRVSYAVMEHLASRKDKTQRPETHGTLSRSFCTSASVNLRPMRRLVAKKVFSGLTTA